MYETYKDRIQFVIVYIREAHPELLPEGNETGIVGRPKDIEERTILATECVMKYKLSLPMVIDGMDGKVNADYQAAPVRVTITDKDGKTVYYAGPGPFDYNTRKIERVLKRLYENGGYPPPPPPPVWGAEEEGLRLGLRVDPAEAVAGEEATVHLVFENRSREPLTLLLDPSKVLEGFAFTGPEGHTLAVEPAGMMGRMLRMMRRMGRRGGVGRPREIDPGGRYGTELDVTLGRKGETAPGRYTVTCTYAVQGSDTLRRLRRSGGNPWSGEVTSGAFTLTLAAPRRLTCADCHGDGDHHHEQEYGCSRCHVGEQVGDDFDINPKSCAECHPREGVQGRRRILGEGGAFSGASVHRPGKIDEKVCLRCHDPEHHGEGTVRLLDPRSGGKKPWTGSVRDFCLACHNGDPPEGVSFPAAKGSGYDKMKASCRAPGAAEKPCLACHASHGSDRPPLLRDDFAKGSGGKEEEKEKTR